jgi:ketosteroid isomerase-like protein
MQTSDSLGNEILGLEKKFWTAMQEQDLETAKSLTDFPCFVAGAHGVQSVDQSKFEEMFNAPTEKIKKFQFDDSKAEVRQVGPDTVVIAYPVQSTFGKDGSEKTMQAVDTSTWVRRNNKWLCVMHTETEVQNQQ